MFVSALFNDSFVGYKAHEKHEMHILLALGNVSLLPLLLASYL